MTGVLQRMVGVGSMVAVLGCAGAPPPAAIEAAPSPGPDALEVEDEIVSEADVSREPEPSLAERWRAPFAVISSGQTAARPARDVTVLGADAAIAAGLAETDASPETTDEASVSVRPGSGATSGASASGSPDSGRGNSNPGPRIAGAGSAEPSDADASAGGDEAVASEESDERDSAPSPPEASGARRLTESSAAARGDTAPSEVAALDKLAPSPDAGDLSPESPESPASVRSAGPSDVRLIGDLIRGEDDSRGVTSSRAALSTAVADNASSDEREESASATDVDSYRVESGDSWIGIARDHDVTFSQLLEANPGADPEHIRIGQVLQIPTAGDAATLRSHRVASGDTLSEIATRYDVSTGTLRELNDLTSDEIRVGQVLILPTD